MSLYWREHHKVEHNALVSLFLLRLAQVNVLSIEQEDLHMPSPQYPLYEVQPLQEGLH